MWSIFDGDAKGVLDALSRSLGVIEFDPSGNVLKANDIFLKLMGYELSEIRGRHHSLFVDPKYRESPDYRGFWAKLRHGACDAGEYKRIGKGGREVWIQASYNPLMNRKGKVVRIVKQAVDITEQKLRNAEVAALLAAVSRAQGIIEFKPSGEVITANENFLAVIGYKLDEIKGQMHRMFVDAAYGASDEYKNFWRRLNAGDFITDEFKRLAKGGKAIWIQASYNPIFDLDGKVVKIVKFATDVTERVSAVDEIASGLDRIAQSNFEATIESSFIPAFERLRKDYNSAVERVRSALREVAHNTSSITNGSHEILTASDDMARRTEQQAANLEETAAALNQITTTIRHTADGAHQAREICARADQDGQVSARIVGGAVNAMGKISTSAKEINQIISMIDEIAFQTNLLALNAGVEAARAGDAGRGFAVVASEVRALAQRSAEAAKSIKNLIQVSTDQVNEGSRLVVEAGEALQRIIRQVSEINVAVSDIASNAKEQAGALTEVNVAVSQMDQVTQQNAAMVEELTAASHSLSGEAGSLNDLVGRFRIGRGQAEDRAQKQATKAAEARPMPSALSPKLRKVVGGMSQNDGDWDEF